MKLPLIRAFRRSTNTLTHTRDVSRDNHLAHELLLVGWSSDENLSKQSAKILKSRSYLQRDPSSHASKYQSIRQFLLQGHHSNFKSSEEGRRTRRGKPSETTRSSQDSTRVNCVYAKSLEATRQRATKRPFYAIC